MKLFGCSFHSVKGGVGKSTLAVATALRLTARYERVWLLDLDLTGTSLSDALPLCAPRWEDEDDLLPIDRAPTGFFSKDETRERIRRRHEAAEAHRAQRTPDTPALGARHVPFLNDFLLVASETRERPRPVKPEALGWRLDGDEAAFDRLRVVPSSALPGDLEEILPVIFDEPRAAFLEGRVEAFLDLLVGDDPYAVTNPHRDRRGPALVGSARP